MTPLPPLPVLESLPNATDSQLWWDLIAEVRRLRDDNERVQAELARMRPVWEAVMTWRKRCLSVATPAHFDLDAYSDSHRALTQAADVALNARLGTDRDKERP